MIKIQKKNFNIEDEISKIKKNFSNIGAVSTFIGFVRDYNNNKDVKYIELEVYNEMAIKELSKIKNIAMEKWGLIECLIIHRYGKLNVSDKIVLVACFSKNRKESIDSCKYIMDYLKKDAPIWKKEYYNEGYNWLKNIS